ncbi:MAG: saccharopine dehydrogenase family protein [Candidatus Heimdallarchaeota archaeon]
MTKIIVLGGCGAVGSVAVSTLASLPDFSEIIIGDINIERAHRIIAELGSQKVKPLQVDAGDPESLKSAVLKADIVLNCIGPFYIFGPRILKAAIEARKNYVDVCDDVDATIELLEMNTIAQQSNITALIGMGSSPGVTNLLAKYAADNLLDEVNSIDIYHAHGGEPFEGPGVIAHRFHAMTADIPVFIDGQFHHVEFFEESGKALEEDVAFAKLGTFTVAPYPHPETITLPKYIPGVKKVTNKGTVLPPEYFQLTADMVRLGLTEEEPLAVQGSTIRPFDFTIAFLRKQREKILEKTRFGTQRGCVKVCVSGRLDEHLHSFVFSLASENQALGEGTGIPAALAVTLMKRGLISEKGVLPPEACIKPMDFMNIMREYLGLESVGEDSSPLIVESIDRKGNVTRLRL